MSIEIDGRSIEALRLTHGIGSHWTARVICEAYTPGEIATISDGATQWVGRVTHSQIVGNSIRLTLTGGKGDWSAEIPALHWIASTTVGDVAMQLAESAGANAEPMGTALPQWRHTQTRLASALNVLCRWAGVQWYQRPGGEIAFGEPSGEMLTDPVSDDGETLTYDVGPRLPMLLSTSVGRVLFLFETGASQWTVTVWPRTVRVPARLSGWIGGSIESQSGELADIKLDDGSTRTGVPLWSSPGVRAVVPSETRVLVFDVGGDPRATVAFASQWTAEVESLELAGGGGKALREGDIVSIFDPQGNPLTGPLAPLSSLPLGLKLHASVAILPGPPGIGHSKVTL